MNVRLFPPALAAVLLLLSSATASAAGSDSAAAARGLLRMSDMPGNLTERTVDTSDSTTSIGPGADCRRYDQAKQRFRRARTARANVIFHDQPDNERISETIGIARTAASAAQLEEAFARSATGRCLGSLLKSTLHQSLGADAAAVTVTVRPSHLPKLGDQINGYDVLVKVPANNGSSQQLGFSFTAMRIGRALALVQLQTASGDLIDQRPAILAAAAKRLHSAMM